LLRVASFPPLSTIHVGPGFVHNSDNPQRHANFSNQQAVRTSPLFKQVVHWIGKRGHIAHRIGHFRNALGRQQQTITHRSRQIRPLNIVFICAEYLCSLRFDCVRHL